MWLPNTFIYQTTAMRVDKITNKLTFSGNLTENDESFLGKLLDGPEVRAHTGWLRLASTLLYKGRAGIWSRLLCAAVLYTLKETAGDNILVST